MSTQYGLQVHSPYDSKSLSPIVISVEAHTQKIIDRADIPGILVIRVFEGAKLIYTESPSKSGVYHTYIVLEGKRAQATIASKINSTGDVVLDIVHTITHMYDETQSSIDTKGILYDTSRVIYQSDILIEKDIKQVCGKQEAKYILYDEGVEVCAIPKLSVHSDDVECSHSLSIGGVDEVAIEYLMARGYSHLDAKKIVAEGLFISTL